MKVATNFTFTQMSAKADIKIIEEKAVAAMIREFRQIDKGPMQYKTVITLIDLDTLSFKDKKRALEVVNLIKENMFEKMKGKICVHGTNQKR